MHLFHYHLVTSELRNVEARYVGKLGFDLVARHGRVADEQVTFGAGTAWETLDRDGFKPRLSEVERGSVNVVVQPGHWRIPRIDHLGVALSEDEFEETIARATAAKLRVQEQDGRRTFVATNAGYRLELHPPHPWLDELLDGSAELQLAELQLRADAPEVKAAALAGLLGLPTSDGSVTIGHAVVSFLPGGPEGRPELRGERFD